MKSEDRNFIHGIARFEQKLRRSETGDLIRVVGKHGTVVGWIASVNEAEPGEGNHVVMIDAEVVEDEDGLRIVSEGDEKHAVTIDYEGAFTSEYDYYVPYVTLTAGQATLGDVETLETRRLEPTAVNYGDSWSEV